MATRIRFALLGITLITPFAAAGDKVDQKLAADAQGVVQIENIRGEVRIRGWAEDAVAVSGELDDLAEGLQFERDGKVTTVTVRMPETNVNSGDGSSLEIRVPAGSRVEFSGVSSSVGLAGTRGGAELRSVSGAVSIDEVRGNLAIKSVSGDVSIARSGGEAQVKAVSGNLDLDLDSRELSLSTVSGDVELKLAEFDRLSLNSVSGTLAISGALAPRGRVDIKTVSGDCRLALRGDIDARASIRTGPGGSISNGLNGQQPETEFPAQQRLETSLGDGTGSISITTVTGDIALGRD